MFSSLRNRFGTPGVIAVIALVLAMVGGAYAASGGLTKQQKKEVKSIAKSFQGTGPAGPSGPAGAKGDTGAAGSNGGNGANGKDGISPTGTNFSGSKTVGSVTCTEGGIEYSGATKNLVCSGKKGEKGEEGSPWTAGGTLPKDATETGTWSMFSLGKGPQFADLSFTIPLAAPLGEEEVHFAIEENFEDFDGAGTGTEGCTGSIVDPTAPSGHLCVYIGAGAGNNVGGVKTPEGLGAGASVAGGVLFEAFGESGGLMAGAWAVTG